MGDVLARRASVCSAAALDRIVRCSHLYRQRVLLGCCFNIAALPARHPVSDWLLGGQRGHRLWPRLASPGYRLRKLSSGIREEIDDAIATELGHPESLSKAVELKDIGWALAGIAVDAVGIVVQLCA